MESERAIARVREVFWAFLKLGLTSFGGPIAHLGYFHDEFVKRRKWLDEQSYADLVALCQFLPGPASSQVGMALGLSRAGVWGSLVAWLGFTLPSAIILTLFGIGVSHFQEFLREGWLHGLKLVAVPIVAQALWSMGNKLCYEWRRALIAMIAAGVAFIFSSAWAQIGVIILGATMGGMFLKDLSIPPLNPISIRLSKRTGAIILSFFVFVLIAIPLMLRTFDFQILRVFESFFRVGSLVFGGGHVVLPLLKAAVVDTGWVSADQFMAGYGAAQAVPGPLFTFAAYLGTVSNIPLSGWWGATICLAAIFLPSFLLVWGALPFWEGMRRDRRMRSGLQGVNAAVVGLLLAAYINPVCTSALFSSMDALIAITGFLLLVLWRWPSWVVVIATALASKLALAI